MAFGWSWFINNGFIADYIFGMILESLWFYIFLFIAGAIWLYLTE